MVAHCRTVSTSCEFCGFWGGRMYTNGYMLANLQNILMALVSVPCAGHERCCNIGMAFVWMFKWFCL